MTDRYLEGFSTRMQEIAPDVEIEVQSNLPGEAELHAVAQRYQQEKDGMVILRSGGSAYLAKNPPSIPTFIGAGNHPVKLGAVNSFDGPDRKISGVTYYVPVRVAVESFVNMAPEVKSLLLLSQSNYVSSAIDWEGLQEGCQAFNLRCEQALVADREELKKAMADNGDRFDGFVLGNQSAALDNADAAAELAGQKPVFSLAEKPIYNGAVGGVLSDDIKLGRWLADAVVAVVVNGKQIKDIPIRIDDEPTLYINMTAARRAGLDIPISILSVAKVIE